MNKENTKRIGRINTFLNETQLLKNEFFKFKQINNNVFDLKNEKFNIEITCDLIITNITNKINYFVIRNLFNKFELIFFVYNKKKLCYNRISFFNTDYNIILSYISEYYDSYINE